METYRIVQRGSKWVVQSEDGSKDLGEHDTREDAEKQLVAVEAAKAGRQQHGPLGSAAHVPGPIDEERLSRIRRFAGVDGFVSAAPADCWDQVGKFGVFKKRDIFGVQRESEFNLEHLGESLDNFAAEVNPGWADFNHDFGEACRAVPSLGPSRTFAFVLDDLAYVTAAANVYRWAPFSNALDDGGFVVKPNDAGATGRWLKAVSGVLLDGVNIATIPTGYLKQVVLHNGDFNDEILNARIYGQAPCVAIHFTGEQHTPLSQIPGALYDYRVRFELWSVSRNYRDRFEAALGSPVAAEAAADPGVMKVHGAVKKLLAGRSGEELGNTSIKYIEIEGGQLEEAREAERIFVMSLQVEVRGSIHNADAPAELVRPTEIDVQRQRVDAPAPGGFDTLNCVTAGLDVPLGLGFASQIAAGSALIGGVPVTAAAVLHTFAASSDTYRDLTPTGAWVFTVVSNGAAVSTPAPANLRVGCTATDAAGIVADTLLCSVQVPFPAVSTPDVIAL
jgi:phage gp37-like protein